MISSWNAWEEWESRSNFRKSLNQFSDEEKNVFMKTRPKVRGAGEYYILNRAFNEKIEIENQKKYDDLQKKWNKNINLFKKNFYKARSRLKSQNMNNWIDLHFIYHDVIDAMKVLNKQERLYIATLKDKESVELILNKQGLSISQERLLDQSIINSKLQALNKIKMQNNCSINDIVFIDDNVIHLLKPKLAGYVVYLATWSNINDEYIAIAKKNNIPTITNIEYLID